MKIEVHCPNCKKTLSIPTEYGGDFHACSDCGEKVLVPLAPGKKVGNFTLIRKIGEGGMGIVYLAEQKSMGRKVALKVLAPQFTRNNLFRDRFEQEIKLQAALSHPNIATAYDAGHDGPLYYLAMEYIEGRGLQTIIKKLGMLREKTALRVTRQIAIAMSYAWKSSKMVHRDIKPSNIIVDDDWNVKILDMGVSKSFKQMAIQSDTRYVVGTPQYMAPEQMTSDEFDHRADIYSLGATLYHMVTGRPPYDEKTLAATISKMQEGPAPHPKEFNSDISSGCAQLIRTMMACKPENRYSYWSSLVADISRVLAGQKPTQESRPKNESYVAYSPRLISKESPSSEKLAEVASRASSVSSKTQTETVNVPAIIIGVLSLLITLMIYATVSQIQNLPDTTVSENKDVLPSPAITENQEPLPAPVSPPLTETNIPLASTVTVVEIDTEISDSQESKEEILLELETLYEFIVERMEENPDHFQAHLRSIRQLRIDADFYGFGKYLILADELEAKNRRHMKQAVHRVIENLSKQAEAAWEEGEYEKASTLFLNYSGPLSRISMQQRRQKAETYRNRIEEMEKAKIQQEQLIKDTVTRLTNRIAEDILAMNPLDPMAIALEEAIASFETIEHTLPLRILQEQVQSIMTIDETILRGFEPEMNKDVISISTSRGNQFVKVRRIDPPNLYVEKQLETGVIEIPIHVDDLSIREKIIRLNGLPDKDKSFLIGILAIKSGQHQAAVSYLSQYEDPLSIKLVESLQPEPTVIPDENENGPVQDPILNPS